MPLGLHVVESVEMGSAQAVRPRERFQYRRVGDVSALLEKLVAKRKADCLTHPIVEPVGGRGQGKGLKRGRRELVCIKSREQVACDLFAEFDDVLGGGRPVQGMAVDKLERPRPHSERHVAAPQLRSSSDHGPEPDMGEGAQDVRVHVDDRHGDDRMPWSEQLNRDRDRRATDQPAERAPRRASVPAVLRSRPDLRQRRPPEDPPPSSARGHGVSYRSGMAEDSADLVADGYEAFYAAWGRSPTLRQIWRDHVTGADYPEEFAHISFVTGAQLSVLTESLSLSSGAVLVDVACGAGGPGLWAAKQTGARLVGIDLAVAATERAAERAGPLGVEDATFRQGTFDATGLGAASADAVMSIDALQYVTDKAKALAEVARILRPGGRFAFVAFELDPARVAGLPFWEDPVADYRPALEAAGLTTIRYEQLAGWADQVAAGFGAILAQRDALEAEMGAEAAAATVMEAAVTIELRPYCGHVFAVATRS